MVKDKGIDIMKFVFFEGDKSTGEIIMNDLENKSNIQIIYRDNVFKSTFLNKLFKLHMSQIINRKFKLPFKKIWFKSLIKRKFANSQPIVFTYIAGWFDLELINWLKKKYPKSKHVLFLRDTVRVYSNAIPSLLKHDLNTVFDLVISYNPEDSNRYGFEYSTVYISRFNPEKLSSYSKSDVVFVGEAKDRMPLIHKLYEKFNTLGLTCDFYITNAESNEQKYSNDIEYTNQHLNYKEYLSREHSSDCIVEVIKGDTQGGTYRCWEAVYYNKKLVTNWKGILDFEFYDPRYMLYFDEVNDITEDFFVNNKNVEYNYNGENSPVNLLKVLEEKTKL